MQLTPGIATEWNMVDNLTWEFKIREGVKAHNGEVINAEDVAYTFERTADPKMVGAGSYPEFILANIKYDRAEVVDEQTVRIHTQEPAPELPAFMWAMLVLPKDYYSSISVEEAALKPVGSGPYKFVEWRKGEQLTLEANEDYFDGPPQAKQVIFRAVPEASSRLAELNTGGADLVVNIPPDLQSQVDAGLAQVVPVEGRRRIYIGFTFYGPNQEAIKDKRVRQALN
jgi:peptide/nickel transport system substrate-binding protein